MRIWTRVGSGAFSCLTLTVVSSLAACSGRTVSVTWPRDLFSAVESCWTHEAPWVDEQVLRVRRFSGTVALDELNVVPDATLFVRSADGSEVVSTSSDAEGRFSMQLPRGSYDVLVCREGFNAWQGRVVISPWAGRNELRLPLTIAF